jgi:hypothetical protein
LVTAGASILGGVFGSVQNSKAAKKIKPYKPTAIERKPLSEFDPGVDALIGAQNDVTLSMLNGELPESVQQQIEDFAAETAMRNGFGWSSQRVGNVTARDLGLASLDLTNQGMAYANQEISRAMDMQASDVSMQISAANMAFDAWKSQTDITMDQARDSARNWNNMFSGVASGASQYYSTKRYDQQRAEDRKFYTDLFSTPKKTYPPAPSGGYEFDPSPIYAD